MSTELNTREPIQAKATFDVVAALLLVLGLVQIWAYVLFGAVSRGFFSSLSGLIMLIAYLGLINLLFFCFVRRRIHGNLKARPNWASFMPISVLAVFLIGICWSALISDIQGDSHYYGQWAHMYHNFALKRIGHDSLIGSFPYHIIIRTISTCAAFLCVFFVLQLTRLRRNKSILSIAFIFILILARIIVVIAAKGSISPHPPLFTFFIWISSTIFGYNNFGLRAAQLIPLFFILVFIQ